MNPADVRRHNVSTMLTDAERAAVEAARGTETRSDWIRRAILARLEETE